MLKNTAGQKWVVFAFDVTDNTPVTGDAANITANLRIDGGEANAVDDTNPAELEDGYYVFDLTQAETNGDLILICPASVTSNVQVIGVPGAVYTVPVATIAGAVWDVAREDHTAAGSFGEVSTPGDIADAVCDEALAGHAEAGSVGAALTAAASAGDPWSTLIPGEYGAGTAGKILGDNINAPLNTIDTVVDAIRAKTDNLPADPADQSDVEAAITAGIGTLPTLADMEASTVLAMEATVAAIPATVAAGAVASVTGAVGSVTGAVTVGTNNDKTGYALSVAGVAAVWAYVVEGTTTAVQIVRGMASVLMGKLSGGGTTTVTFRDLGDTKDRIEATVDSSGNRTAVTRTLT